MRLNSKVRHLPESLHLARFWTQSYSKRTLQFYWWLHFCRLCQYVGLKICTYPWYVNKQCIVFKPHPVISVNKSWYGQSLLTFPLHAQTHHNTIWPWQAALLWPDGNGLTNSSTVAVLLSYKGVCVEIICLQTNCCWFNFSVLNCHCNLIWPYGQVGSINIQNKMSSSSVTAVHPSISRLQSDFPLYLLPNEIVVSLWL